MIAWEETELRASRALLAVLLPGLLMRLQATHITLIALSLVDKPRVNN